MRAIVRHRVLVMEHLDMDQPTDRGRAMDTHRRPTVTTRPLMVMAIRTRISARQSTLGLEDAGATDAAGNTISERVT